MKVQRGVTTLNVHTSHEEQELEGMLIFFFPPASAQSEATVLCPGARNERKSNQLHLDAKIRWDQTGSLNRRPFPVCYSSSTSYCMYRKCCRDMAVSYGFMTVLYMCVGEIEWEGQ